MVNMHSVYANSLQQFIERINEELLKEAIPTKKVAPIQYNLNAAAKQLQGIKP